ncbi:MAG TPA: hypothetical protein VH440_04240 [Candidatus Limnocylindrales bacterium]
MTVTPRVTSPFAGDPFGYVFAATPYETGFVAVGEVAHGERRVDGAIWRTDDGTDWTTIDSVANDLRDAEIDMIATDGRHLVAMGLPRPRGDAPDVTEPLVWVSEDGDQWRRLPTDAARFDVTLSDVTAGPGGFVAWSGDWPSPSVFHSSDGVSWTRVSTDPSFENAIVASVRPFGTGFVAVGRYVTAVTKPPQAGTAASWWSDDGVEWHRGATESGFGLGGLETGSHGLLALGSPSECTACVGQKAITWASRDGASWRPIGTDLQNYPGYSSNGDRIIRYDWQGTRQVATSADGERWTDLGAIDRIELNGRMAVGRTGILLIGRYDPASSTAGTVYLAAEERPRTP